MIFVTAGLVGGGMIGCVEYETLDGERGGGVVFEREQPTVFDLSPTLSGRWLSGEDGQGHAVRSVFLQKKDVNQSLTMRLPPAHCVDESPRVNLEFFCDSARDYGVQSAAVSHALRGNEYSINVQPPRRRERRIFCAFSQKQTGRCTFTGFFLEAGVCLKMSYPLTEDTSVFSRVCVSGGQIYSPVVLWGLWTPQGEVVLGKEAFTFLSMDALRAL